MCYLKVFLVKYVSRKPLKLRGGELSRVYKGRPCYIPMSHGASQGPWSMRPDVVTLVTKLVPTLFSFRAKSLPFSYTLTINICLALHLITALHLSYPKKEIYQQGLESADFLHSNSNTCAERTKSDFTLL